MSQHYYKTTHKNRPVEVVMGWDRQLQEYFLWIEYTDLHDDEEEEFLWHSMDCHVAFPEEIAFILRVLTDFKIEVPSVMIRAVEEDCLQNVGNKEVIYAQPVEGDKTSFTASHGERSEGEETAVAIGSNYRNAMEII